MIQIIDMTAFVTVVQVASFTEAAKRLEVTKSVVSRRIADLERELGVPLLDRGTRGGVRPTEVGAVYYAKCVRILESIHAANDFVAGFNSVVKGRLNVVVPNSFADALVTPLLNRFAALYPDILLDVSIGGDGLVDTNFDMAIRVGEIDEPDMIARPMASYRNLLCASPGYLDHQRSPSTPDELIDHDGLADAAVGTPGTWRLQVRGDWKDIRYREKLRSSSCRHLISAACDGLGIVMVPDLLVTHELESGCLRPLLMDYPAPSGSLSVVYPKSRRASQKVQRLLGFLLESTIRS